MKRYLFLGLVLIFVLLGYGAFRFPSALSSPSGLLGDCIILIVYGLVIWFWFPSLADQNNQISRIGYRSGVVIGVIFASEMILEYILLLTDNTGMGLFEYGSVLAIFFIVGLWITYQTRCFRNGVFTALVAAILGSMVWLIAALIIFYLFHGTPQQTQVFQAEGNLYDFAQSGMTDFDAFIMRIFGARDFSTLYCCRCSQGSWEV